MYMYFLNKYNLQKTPYFELLTEILFFKLNLFICPPALDCINYFFLDIYIHVYIIHEISNLTNFNFIYSELHSPSMSTHTFHCILNRIVIFHSYHETSKVT